MVTKSIYLVLFVMASAGCTSMQLQYSTLAQGRTLTDLQYQIVLDNVAMFRQAPGSLPWHLKIESGTVTINDTVNPSFSYTGPVVSRTYILGGARIWQEGWTVVPVVNSEELSALKHIYEWAAKQTWIEEGTVPDGFVWGRYGTRIVSVRLKNLEKLTNLTLKVLKAVPVKDLERTLRTPGPPPTIR
jgi:hypothetical protein